MPSVHLADRGVVRVSGEDAKAFLDNLVTCDLDRVSPQAARFGALLTPQGKILFDFLVFQSPQEIGGAYYLDMLKVFAPDLAKRLGFQCLELVRVARLEVDDRNIVAGIGKGNGNAAAHAARAKTCDGGTGAHAAKPSRSSFSSAA